MRLLLISLISSFAVTAGANELVIYKVSLFQQTCRRADVKKPFYCHNSGPLKADLSVTLKTVTPTDLEEQAFEGASDEIGLSVGLKQYIAKVILRKSIYRGGQLVEYRPVFQTYMFDGTQNPVVYQIDDVTGSASLDTPVFLLLDRSTSSDLFNEQNFITFGH